MPASLRGLFRGHVEICSSLTHSHQRPQLWDPELFPTGAGRTSEEFRLKIHRKTSDKTGCIMSGVRYEFPEVGFLLLDQSSTSSSILPTSSGSRACARCSGSTNVSVAYTFHRVGNLRKCLIHGLQRNFPNEKALVVEISKRRILAHARSCSRARPMPPYAGPSQSPTDI